MKCPSCGAENPDDYRFCARCGIDMTSVPEPEPVVEEPGIEEKVCPKCGTANPIGYEYCSKCGAKLEPAVEEPEAEGPKEEENTGIREESVPKPPKQRNPKGRRNAIVAVALVFVLAVAAIAVFTMSSPEEEPPDRPLDWLKTPDGTYTYDNEVIYNGQTVKNTIRFTLEDEKYIEYSINGNYLDKTQLRELNIELEEQRKLSYTYTDGETWNDGSKEYSTYDVCFNGVNDMQTITDTGIIVYEFLSEEGVVSTTTLKGWSKGLLYHTVTFNYMNGGKESQTVHHGDTITLPSYATKEGYSPVGWHMNYEYTGNPYALGSQFVVTDDVTFYMGWEQNKYKTAFVLNGGSYSGLNPHESYYNNGFYLPKASEVTRSGYTLKGWDTDPSANTVVYSPGSVYIVKGDSTLYAVWNVTSAVLTFHGNGGDGTYTKIVDIGSTISMPSATINPGQTISYTGFNFRGWSLSSMATTPDYYAGNSYKVTENVTFYAVWEIKEYNIRFDGNGTGQASSQIAIHGMQITLPGPSDFTKAGCTLLGWSKSSTATSPTYECGAKITIETNCTFYAVWGNSTPTQHHVTLDAGVQSDRQYGSLLVDHGNTCEPGYYPISETGYAFDCWTLNGVEYDSSQPVTSDITLKARWVKVMGCVFSGTTVSLTNYLGSPLDVFWGDNRTDLSVMDPDHTYDRSNVHTTIIVMADYNGKRITSQWKVDIGSDPGFTTGIGMGQCGWLPNKYYLNLYNTGSDVPLTWVFDFFPVSEGSTAYVETTVEGPHWISLIGTTSDGIYGSVRFQPL